MTTPASITTMLAVLATLGCAGAEAAAPGATPAAADPAVARAVAALDAATRADWKARGLTPGAAATDAEWLRRASLDLLGRIPTLEEARAFAAAPAVTRRTATIDRMLASEESARHRAWGIVDRLAKGAPSKKGWDERALHAAVAVALQRGKGWDAIVRDLLVAEGSTGEVGAANYLAMSDGNPADMASRAATHFLGLTMECAQCHDHPDGDFTRDRFWGLASFFARTSFVADPTAMGGYRFHLVELPYGEVRMGMAIPGTGPILAPTFPDGTPGPTAPDAHRRKALAAWITSPKNSTFAATRVRTVAATLLGQAPGGATLDALVALFTSTGFDERRLHRAIVSSAAYALSSRPAGKDEAVAPVRALTLREIVRSVAVASGAPWEEPRAAYGKGAIMDPDAGDGDGDTAPPGAKGPKAAKGAKAAKRPKGPKAAKGGGPPAPTSGGAPDLMGALDGLSDLGRRSDSTSALEPGATDPTLLRALFFANGRLLDASTLPFPGSTLASLVARDAPFDAALDDLYATVLARAPTAPERSAFGAHLRAASSAVAGWSDVLWALFNSSEFSFRL